MHPDSLATCFNMIVTHECMIIIDWHINQLIPRLPTCLRLAAATDYELFTVDSAYSDLCYNKFSVMNVMNNFQYPDPLFIFM